MKDFYGFQTEEFIFDARQAIVVLANEANRTDKWLFKTEYFGAFPELEIEMLREGYNLAHVDNTTRWCLPEDTARQADFCRYLHTNFGFSEKCVPVGMSCGGMQAIYLAASHPELVAALYLDAPVINFLSCPAGLGNGVPLSMEEFTNARGMSLSDLISYRNHPLDRFRDLSKDIPILLACGDKDEIVPFEENGALLVRFASEHGLFVELHMKPGIGHHPHGLSDNTPIHNFIKKYY